MGQILILICSIYVPPAQCDRRHAIDSYPRNVPVMMSGLAGQVEAAATVRGPDPYHYEKIVTGR